VESGRGGRSKKSVVLRPFPGEKSLLKGGRAGGRPRAWGTAGYLLFPWGRGNVGTDLKTREKRNPKTPSHIRRGKARAQWALANAMPPGAAVREVTGMNTGLRWPLRVKAHRSGKFNRMRQTTSREWKVRVHMNVLSCTKTLE